MGYGKALKQILAKKGMTLKELASISGISVNTLYTLTQRDPEGIRSETLIKILDALQLTEPELQEFSEMVSSPGPAYVTSSIPKELVTRQFARIIDAFLQLNTHGKEKAVERVEELTEIPRYMAPDPQGLDGSQEEKK